MISSYESGLESKRKTGKSILHEQVLGIVLSNVLIGFGAGLIDTGSTKFYPDFFTLNYSDIFKKLNFPCSVYFSNTVHMVIIMDRFLLLVIYHFALHFLLGPLLRVN